MANEFVPAGLSAPVGNAAPVTAVPAGVQNASGTPLVAGTQITTDLLNAGIGSFKGDPSLIRSNNAIASTDMLRPFNVNNAGRGSAYPGPVATPRNANIAPGTANNAGYNQLMMELAQHFDPMIQISVLDQPRWWHDRIPRGAYTLFNGVTHETRIYRGGLMKYAGLSQWKDINPVPSTTNNPCAALPYETYKYGWEALSWSGKKAAWGSDPICLDMFKFFTQAMQQLSWILTTGAEYGIQMQEVWNRDMFIYQSVVFGRSYVMNSEFNGTGSARYWYNPFVDSSKFTAAGNLTSGIIAAIGGKAFIVVDASVDIEPLNFDVLDQVRESLKIRCPRAAVTNAGGDPIFALAVSHDDVERYIRGNEEERKYWIEGNPQALIKGYDFAPSTFRKWLITNDGNQLRFKIVAKVEYTTATATAMGGVASEFAGSGKYAYIAVAVDPLIASPTRVGVDGSPIPEDNPEYYKAELAIAPIFMNQVFTNQFVPSVASLGSGTQFGPVPGLNGSWGWMNIIDREVNPLGNIGNFYGLFEIVPKPEPHVFHTISFLYRRCIQALPSLCPAQNTNVNTAAKTTTTLAEGILATTDSSVPSVGDVLGVKFVDNLLADVGDVLTIADSTESVGVTFKGVVLARPSGKTATIQLTSNASATAGKQVGAGAAVSVS